MDENNKILTVIGVIFAFFLGYQIFANLIPSIIEGSKSVEEITENLPPKEKIRKSFQNALEKYIENNENESPKTFSDFVTYKENKPKKATMSLDEFNDVIIKEEDVKGLDSKMLSFKIINTETKKKEIIVLLLNQSYVSLTEL